MDESAGTPFRPILAGLAAQHAGTVRAAVFCDEEGERVESVIADKRLDPYELDLYGASYAPIVARMLAADLMGRGAITPAAMRMRIVHPHTVVWLQGIVSGYYLVVLAARSGRDLTIGPMLDEVVDALIAHM